jgi:hypothetical protein
MMDIMLRSLSSIGAATFSLVLASGAGGQEASLSVSRPATTAAPRADAPDPQRLAAIAAVIRRQIQPCANRQIKPGPGAERIVVTLALHLNRDGSLAMPPEVVGSPSGVDDQNRPYLGPVVEGAIAAFTQCSPFRGLPLDYYGGTGGWNSFRTRYKLPG